MTSISPSRDDDRAGQVAELLRIRYGPDAAAVARRQLDEAEEEGRAMWQAILDRLSI